MLLVYRSSDITPIPESAAYRETIWSIKSALARTGDNLTVESTICEAAGLPALRQRFRAQPASLTCNVAEVGNWRLYEQPTKPTPRLEASLQTRLRETKVPAAASREKRQRERNCG